MPDSVGGVNPTTMAKRNQKSRLKTSGMQVLRPVAVAVNAGLWVGLTLMDMEGNEHDYIVKEVRFDGA